MRFALMLVLTAAMSCQADETVRAYGASDRVWVLSELGGQPFSARATLQFPEQGVISGRGPCNGFSGQMDVPYPWFKAGPLRATKRACAALAEETRYFRALAQMSTIEVLGEVMILSNDAGDKMVFKASE